MPEPFPTDALPMIDQSLPVEEQVTLLAKVVADLARATHLNTFNGLQRQHYMASVPAVADLDEGQIVLGLDGATKKLYTKIGGARFEITLTAV